MSDKVDRFTEDLNQKLTQLEAGLGEVKSRIDDAMTRGEAFLDTKREEMRVKAEATRQGAEQNRKQLEAKATAVKSSAKGKIAEWKAGLRRDMLEDRAANATDYAKIAITVAADAIEEAELASLEAIVAIRDADEAADTAKAAKTKAA